ncbi:MAG: hypothetical protein HZC28_00825 [Spirochaetes bacterium]|nr:hypothetical protein [Spirochaetota bacterium]
MRVLKALILAVILFAPLAAQISYDILHTNALVTYDNALGVPFTNTNCSNMSVPLNAWTNNSPTNTNNISTNILTVNELPLAKFVLSTNGAALFAGSPFFLNIRAVDAFGNHVTVTNVSNLTFSSLNNSLNLTTSNLAVTNMAFVSPSAVVPDLFGSNFSNAYAVPGLIYIRVDQNTNTDMLGLLNVRPGIVGGLITFDRSTYVGHGERALITVNDADRNITYDAVDSVVIHVTSTADASGKDLVLYETGVNTGVFTHVLRFETALSAAPGKIYATNNSIVYAAYADTSPVATTTVSALFRAVSDVTKVGTWPNPFDMRVTPTMYMLNLPPDTSYVKIYTIDGKLVRTLVPGGGIGNVEVQGARFFGATWDGKDEQSNPVRPGLYLMEMRTPQATLVKKFGVLR